MSAGFRVRVHFQYGDERRCGMLLRGLRGMDGYARVDDSAEAELLLAPDATFLPLEPPELAGSAIYWVAGPSVIGFDLVAAE